MTFFNERMNKGEAWPSFRGILAPGDAFVLTCVLTVYRHDVMGALKLKPSTVYMVVARPALNELVLFGDGCILPPVDVFA